MKIILITATLLTLVSCGKTEAEKHEERVQRRDTDVNRANSKIDEMKNILKKLSQSYVVSINSTSTNISNSKQSAEIKGFTYNECEKVKSLLSRYISLTTEVQSIANANGDVINNQTQMMTKMMLTAKDINNRTKCEHTYDNDFSFKTIEARLEQSSSLRFIVDREKREVTLTIKENNNISTEDKKPLQKFIDDIEAYIEVEERGYIQDNKLKLAKELLEKMDQYFQI